MGSWYMSENITEIRRLVIEKLKNYNQNRQRLAALRYERENFSGIDADEVISFMNFSHNAAGGTANAFSGMVRGHCALLGAAGRQSLYKSS